MSNFTVPAHELDENNCFHRSTPEAEGISSKAIQAFLDGVKQEKLELHSLMILRNGKVITEGAWSPYELETKHFMFSLSKSVTSTAVGFAVSEGLLSLDDKVVSFFPEHSDLDMDEKMASMTVRHLLTMTSGYIENISGSLIWSHKKTSWVKEFLQLPLTYAPGTHFVYNSGSSHMLSAIVTKVTGLPISDYLKPRLFDKIKIENYTWDKDPEGNNTGGWGIRFSTEDIAKFGQFYLQKGKWEGEQILPVEWIDQATTYQISTAHLDKAPRRQGYGFQFWVSHHGVYRANGAFGQTAIMLPHQNTVIAITAGMDQGEDIIGLVWEHLYPAFQSSPLEEDTVAYEQLQENLENLSLFSAVPHSSSVIAEKVSGKKYQMKTNEDGIHTIQFDFSNDECVFTMEDDTGTHTIRCGIGEWIQEPTTMPGAIIHHMQQPDDLTATARGVWENEKTFIMTWTYHNMPFSDTVTCHFEGNKLIFIRHSNVKRHLDRPLIIGVQE